MGKRDPDFDSPQAAGGDEGRTLRLPVSGEGSDATLLSPQPGSDATLISAEAVAGERPRASEAPSETPARIGAYEIVRELGRGGMGVVYLARDPALDREIALKVLTASLAADPRALDLFQREARLLAALNHPAIPSIYTLEEQEGLRFLTMELVSGTNLTERIRDRATPLREWLVICRRIATALEAAHRLGIAHLDLKPQNIVVRPGGEVKVLDFGLARAIDPEAARARGDPARGGPSTAIAGTPGYMSPEQLRGEPVDARADLFAFGCILFECLAGCPAFSGKNAWERARATLEVRAPIRAEARGESPPEEGAPCLLPDEVPDPIRDLLDACLERDPARRLDSATRVRRALEQEIALLDQPPPEMRREEQPGNLPEPRTSFVGRAQEKAAAHSLLEEHVLVTLTGVGGCGKTRLALEVGRRSTDLFPDGAWWVDLSPVASPDLVPAAALAALALKETPGLTPLGVLSQFLRERRALLLLDHCEPLRSAAGELVTALLGACPALRILATSRQALGVAGETIFHVPPLAVPPADEGIPAQDLIHVESVQLFLARARAALPDFALDEANAGAIALLCRRLDGIPLALELAAARVGALGPEEILGHLEDLLPALAGAERAAPGGLQTLGAMIDWSYRQLEDKEQVLLRRLSLFAGGWTLDAAEALCVGGDIEGWEVHDLLRSLLAQSMAESDAEGGRDTGLPRFRMLETIRDFARARLLERREGAEILERLRGYFLALVEETAPRLAGPEQARFLRRLTAENDNLRLALDLCNVPSADPELGWRLAGALGRFWYLRGQWSEGRKALEELLSRQDAERATPAAAEALNWAGNLAKLQGDYAQARAHLEECLALRRRLGQGAGIASALINLANVLKDQGDLVQARAFYEEGLRLQRSLDNLAGVALALNALGVLTFLQRDFAASLGYHEESLSLRRQAGDRSAIAASLNNLGAAAEHLGDYDRATRCLVESLALQREIGDRWGVAASLTNLGRLAVTRGDPAEARVFYEEGLLTFRALGDRRGAAACLNNLGLLSLKAGESAAAGGRLRESLAILAELDARPGIAEVLHALGLLEAAADRATAAGLYFGAAEALRQACGSSLSAEDETALGAAYERLRSGSSATAFDEAYARGRASDLAETVSCALRATA